MRSSGTAARIARRLAIFFNHFMVVMRLTYWPFASRIRPSCAFALCLPFAASLWACAPQAVAPANAPPTPPPPVASNGWKQVEPAKAKAAPGAGTPPGCPPATAACEPFVKSSSATCAPTGDGRAELAQALTSTDALKRDEQLSCLEQAPTFPQGVLRALRAELAPPACADVIVMPLLEPRRPEIARRVEDTLIALAASGRLARLVQKAPELAPPFDRARFMDFFQTTLKPWIVTQAAAIHDLSTVGPRLSPYAKGVVAIEAGLADMRFVSVVRQVPLPKEMRRRRRGARRVLRSPRRSARTAQSAGSRRSAGRLARARKRRRGIRAAGPACSRAAFGAVFGAPHRCARPLAAFGPACARHSDHRARVGRSPTELLFRVAARSCNARRRVTSCADVARHPRRVCSGT